MTSGLDRAKNIATAMEIIDSAAERGTSMLFFPECFAFIGDGVTLTSSDVCEPLQASLASGTLSHFAAAAAKHSMWLSLGGWQEKSEFSAASGRPKVYNTHFVLDSSGSLRAAYRKLHLFDLGQPLSPSQPVLRESDSAVPGEAMVVVQGTPVGALGLTTCYDLRFPALYARLCAPVAEGGGGATALAVPAAFTVPTGQAHWETLLRARAIENQAYVFAAAQVGHHHHNQHPPTPAPTPAPVAARTEEGATAAEQEGTATHDSSSGSGGAGESSQPSASSSSSLSGSADDSTEASSGSGGGGEGGEGGASSTSAGAAGQAAPAGRVSWGQALAVDPWGTVLAEAAAAGGGGGAGAGPPPSVLYVAYQAQRVASTRARMPVLQHRREAALYAAPVRLC